MISLLCSNHPDELVARLCADLAEHTPRPPEGAFHVSTILVPSRVLQGFITAEVARTRGIAANLEFSFMEEFVEELARKTLPDSRLLRRQDLVGLIHGQLDDESMRERLPGPVLDYLETGCEGDDGPRHREHKLFGLADQLSRIFEIYSVSRTEMVDAWLTGRSWYCQPDGAPRAPEKRESPTLETEAWQAELWRLLFAPGGRRDRIQERTGIRWLTLRELVGRLEPAAVSLPPRLYLFGFSSLSEAHRGLLEWLGRSSDLGIYLYAPFVDGREPPNEPSVARSPGETLAHLWGRPGRENLRAIGALTGVQSETHPVTPRAPGLLGSLQRQILGRPGTGDGSPAVDAESIQVLACPGTRREMEVVASEIWELVRSDPNGDTSERLRFRDIAVVLADELSSETYVSNLQTVFGDVYGLPFKMMDAPSLAARRVNEAVRMLVDLPLRSIERRSVLPLLTHPLVRSRFPDADVDLWRLLCSETGVFFGADHADHEGLYVEKDLYSFDQAIRRLALGAFLTGQRSGDERTLDLGGRAYLPQELSQDDTGDAALFATLVRSLIADARFARTRKRTLTDWVRLLTGQLAVYFEGESPDEKRALGLTVKALSDLSRHDVGSEPVPYRVIHGMVTEELEALASGHGSYLSEGITVGSLASLRGLPFAVVFVCGLGEGRFPAADSRNPLDLRVHDEVPREGDVFIREQDRYRFLELLACTRDRLYLSYVARDPLTGNALEPSSVVQELHYAVHRDHVFEAIDPERRCSLVRLHPLRRHDERYFPPPGEEATRLVSHDPAARREANALRLGRDHERILGTRPGADADSLRSLDPAVVEWLGLAELPAADPTKACDVVPVSLSAILGFLQCPLQGWARHAMGLDDDEEGDDPARWDEPFSLDRKNATVLLRNAFVTALAEAGAGQETPDFRTTFGRLVEVAELRGRAPTGRFLEREMASGLATLDAWLANSRFLGVVPDGPGARRLGPLRFGRADEHERVESPRDPIILTIAPPPGRPEARPVTVELYGRTQILTDDCRTSVVPVKREGAGEVDFLKGFLDAVFLAAAEKREPSDHTTCVLTERLLTPRMKILPRRVFRSIGEDDARQYLERVISDMLFESHDYLLPFEAVAAFAAPKNRASLSFLVRRLKEDALADPKHNGFSSTRGPLPDPLRFEPPDDARAVALFERRFGLYFQPPAAGEDRR